jgi:Kdo2-lipid IVA lauroyltransferase/acyltransferase
VAQSTSAAPRTAIPYRLLGWLPFPVLYGAAWLAYLAIYYVAGYRRQVVRENLSNAFADRNARELTVLAKKFYRQLTEVAVEIVKARRMQHADFLARARVCNPELLRQCSNDFRDSVIVLTIHQGNWEWMLHGTTAALGIAMDPVYKPLHNQSLDSVVFEIRARFGSRPIAVNEATADILRRRREPRCLVLVADQAPAQQEHAHWTQFMGRSAAFHTGPARLAKLTGFPVVFAQCRRRRRGYYEIEFHPLAVPPYGDDPSVIIERYVRLAERAIGEEPESWLWSHRRWRRQTQDD